MAGYARTASSKHQSATPRHGLERQGLGVVFGTQWKGANLGVLCPFHVEVPATQYWTKFRVSQYRTRLDEALKLRLMHSTWYEGTGVRAGHWWVVKAELKPPCSRFSRTPKIGCTSSFG